MDKQNSVEKKNKVKKQEDNSRSSKVTNINICSSIM